MKKVVISQPMFFPWVGLFEQIRLADVYVHYDDVQLPQGRSFITRVQIKSPQGVHWLTAPVRRLGSRINEVVFDGTQPWRKNHLATLRQFYARAPFVKDMLNVAEPVYAFDHQNLSHFNCKAIETIAAYFGFEPEFTRSSELQVMGQSTERLLDITNRLGGDVYITGHGAKNYLDHELFETNGIRVEYMNYEKRPYPQLHGEFTPFVSVLDLIANVGKAGREYICSGTKYWKEFINE